MMNKKIGGEFLVKISVFRYSEPKQVVFFYLIMSSVQCCTVQTSGRYCPYLMDFDQNVVFKYLK